MMDQTAHALEQCVASEYFNKEIVLSYYSKYLKSNLFWDHNKFTYGSIKAIASNRFTCEEFLGCWRSLMCCDVITDTWRNQFFSTHTHSQSSAQRALLFILLLWNCFCRMIQRLQPPRESSEVSCAVQRFVFAVKHTVLTRVISALFSLRRFWCCKLNNHLVAGLHLVAYYLVVLYTLKIWL